MATPPAAPAVVLEHRTRYDFDRPTALHPHVVRLRPLPYTRTPVLDYAFTVDPSPQLLNWQQDPFGNHVARLSFADPADHLDIGVTLTIDPSPINPFEFFLEPFASDAPFAYGSELAADLAPYLEPPTFDPALDAFVERVRPDPTTTMAYLVDLNRRTFAEIEYVVRLEAGVQEPVETLESGVGSCRDSAWLLVQALRVMGLAARFVSGYLIQIDTPDGDTADLHAWAEVFLPGAGWVGLDATSGLLTGETHIPLAAAPRPTAAAAITGTTGPADVSFSFSTEVRRV